MRYLKTYEQIVVTDKPQIGDYVICKFPANYISNQKTLLNREIIDFMNNNIGKIIKISKHDTLTCGIRFENIPIKLNRFFCYENDNSRWINLKNIIYWSPDKEQILSIQHLLSDTNKYNL